MENASVDIDRGSLSPEELVQAPTPEEFVVPKTQSDVDDISSLLEEAKKCKKELFEGQGSVEAVKIKVDEIALGVQDARQKIADKKTEIDALYTEIQKNKEEFSEYYKKIFGSIDGDGKIIASGLKQEIEDKKGSLDGLYVEKEKELKALFNKIEGLLPGATSAGLAATYEAQKRSYWWPNIIWSVVFCIAMVGMGWYAIKHETIGSTLQETIFRTIGRLPFFIPAIWLGYFASKQQSQNKRLAQEYAHKESLSRSFVGYKKQIEELGQLDESKDIMKGLLAALIEVAGSNPSSTLDSKYHQDEPSIFKAVGSFLLGKVSKEDKG